MAGIVNNERIVVGLDTPASVIRRRWQLYFERVEDSNILKVALYHRFSRLPDDCGVIFNFEAGKVVVLQKIRGEPEDCLIGYVPLRERQLYTVLARPIHSYNHPCLEVRERHRWNSGPGQHS